MRAAVDSIIERYFLPFSNPLGRIPPALKDRPVRVVERNAFRPSCVSLGQVAVEPRDHLRECSPGSPPHTDAVRRCPGDSAVDVVPDEHLSLHQPPQAYSWDPRWLEYYPATLPYYRSPIVTGVALFKTTFPPATS